MAGLAQLLAAVLFGQDSDIGAGPVHQPGDRQAAERQQRHQPIVGLGACAGQKVRRNAGHVVGAVGAVGMLRHAQFLQEPGLSLIHILQLNFRVSPEELALIEQKMAQLGTKNREAYLRKMALDGYVVRLELPELKEMVSLMRYSSNNLNQLTRRVHETGRIYDADLEDISRRQEALWDGVHRILTQLAKLS